MKPTVVGTLHTTVQVPVVQVLLPTATLSLSFVWGGAYLITFATKRARKDLLLVPGTFTILASYGTAKVLLLPITCNLSSS